MIRILVADDHAVVRRGICSLISLAQDMELVAEAANSEQVLTLINDPRISLLIVDMNMPGLSGVDLIKKVREQQQVLPILVFSMVSESQSVEAALMAGANGYLAKTSDPEIILAAARQCAAGGSYIDPGIAISLILSQKKMPETRPHEKLSKRELQIMLMLASGVSVSRIAESLFVSPKTVSTHKFRIMQKLGLESIAELVRYALRYKLIDN